MMQAALWLVAVLLALAPAGIALSMQKRGSAMLYGACLVVTTALVAISLFNLLDSAHPVLSATLPQSRRVNSASCALIAVTSSTRSHRLICSARSGL